MRNILLSGKSSVYIHKVVRTRMVRKKKMRDPDFVLCVLLPNARAERFKITDIHNFSTSSVEDIKYRASQRTGLQVEELVRGLISHIACVFLFLSHSSFNLISSHPFDLDLSYRGCILQNDKKISECDFKKGATIFVTKKKQPAHIPEKMPINESAIKAVSKALKKRTTHLLYWSYLEKMKVGAGMEILIARNPGLISDPVSLAVLLDSDLLENLSDLSTAKRAAELHPALLETVNQVMKEISDEKRNDNSELPSASLSLEAALANHSDMQDMDASQSSDPVPGSSSQNRVNVADAALLASLGEMPEPYHVEALAPSSHSPPMLITPEMVSQAMQSAMASVAVAPMPHMATSSSASTPTQSGDATMLGLQLQQMEELGLLDNAANMQALTATGGDVQAAINLLLSGGITSDDEN